MFLSRAYVVSDRYNSSDVRPADKRRWTTFLTWAFVLAEMAGRDGYLPTAARAAEEDAGGSSHVSNGSEPTANNLPNLGVNTSGDAPEPITYQEAAAAPPLPPPTALASNFAEAYSDTSSAAAHGGDIVAPGGGGVAYGSSDSPANHSGQAGSPADTSLSMDGSAVELIDCGPLDIGLHLGIDLGGAVQGLLGGLADGAANLPVVGLVLEGVGNTLTNAADGLLPVLQPIVSLTGDGHQDAHDLDLGLPGRLDISDGPSAAPNDLAASGGGYTDYGIALNIDADNTSHSPGLMATDVEAGSFDLLHVDPGSISDAFNDDHSIIRSAADTLT